RHALPDGVANAVTDDDDHVVVLEHVRFVADAAVAGNDVRAALFEMLRHRQVENPVQPVDVPSGRPAIRDVDDGIGVRPEDIAGRMLSNCAAAPVSTTSTPSSPTETTMFAPPPMSA